jgi:hypothetical protein
VRISSLVGSLLVGGLLHCGTVTARPVVYTLHTVADGTLDGRAFTQTALVIEFRGDTDNIVTNTLINGAVVLTNSVGSSKVTVTIGGKPHQARFAPGQIYVRYDTSNGIVGFGSFGISPTYPVAIGCDNDDCTGGDVTLASYLYWGIVGAASDLAAYPGDWIYFSYEIPPLPVNLSKSTLLTGNAHTCAVPYATYQCLSPASLGLHTDRGDLFLQDQTYGYDSRGGHLGVFTVEVNPED